MKDLYEIKHGAVTVYVSEWRGTEFKFKGFTVSNDTENYYVVYNSKYDPFPTDRTIVELGKYLFNIYKTEADNQLQQYISDNINSYDFYAECQDNNFPFWSDIINTAGNEPKFNENYDIDLTDVMIGVVRLSLNGINCAYSFINRKTIGYELSNKQSEPISSSMALFYRGKILNELLALEQYKRGVGVPAYTELVGLKEFLQGKKSIKFVMKSGEVYELKKDQIFISSILNQYYSDGRLCFNLNNSYYLKPSMKTVQPLSELNYLQYGKQKHYISEQNLSHYTKNI